MGSTVSQPTNATSLTGYSCIAGNVTATGGSVFQGYDPTNGQALEPAFHSATAAGVDQAVRAARDAFPVLARTSGVERGKLLRRIADGLNAAASEITARAQQETALPLPRLNGELARTCMQLRLFASVIEDGSWVAARIDTADPARTPPKPDIRCARWGRWWSLAPVTSPWHFPLPAGTRPPRWLQAIR